LWLLLLNLVHKQGGLSGRAQAFASSSSRTLAAISAAV
jgi:hypothetical protein